MVICGGNGCGKSTLLEALITAKEYAGSYTNPKSDLKAVSADAPKAEIKITLEFTEKERSFVKDKFNTDCLEVEEVSIEINKSGGVSPKRSQAVQQLLKYYSRAPNSPGFFDYIDAHRQTRKSTLRTYDAELLSDDRTKQTLAHGENKFQLTKPYLAGFKFRYLQELDQLIKEGNFQTLQELKCSMKSGKELDDIREIFNQFFAPMKFEDVDLRKNPFDFIVSTPMGNIDIDDLSSGEQEILNIFIRIHQLKPNGAVILFDEADAHLHPDLERRYLQALKRLSKGNQLLLTTHSPEMMIAAGTESLYTILKEPPEDGSNQLIRVTHDEQMHGVLSDLMGSRGIVSFNQRIVFIEGEYASADREIYEAAYPPAKYNISFVAAGNSATVRKTADKVNLLLNTPLGFQQYFSIVDGDITERFEPNPTEGNRLFRLPVYHVENLLLDENEIFEVTYQMLGSKCPYKTAGEVKSGLRECVLLEPHLCPYTEAFLDAKIAKSAKEAYDAVYQRRDLSEIPPIHLEFPDALDEAREVLQSALDDGTWRAKCKGRDLLKAYCGKNGLKYEHFRNLLIARIKSPPRPLAEIMDKILQS
jgi:predicted ATPase